MDTATTISLLISIAAFALSIIALWQTYFAKFKLVSAVGNLQIRIYPFRHRKEKWSLPTIDIPISLTNEGARVGKVLGLRIQVRFPDHSEPKNYKIMGPKCEVDYKKFESKSNQLFEWMDEAVIGEWMPFVVLPKQTVTKHLVFQSRWEDALVQDNVIFELEISTSTKRKWRKIAKWNGTLSREMWSTKMTEVSSFIFPEENMVTIEIEKGS
ncbi:MAG: hypothetical protein ACOYZ8_03815 [Chloroflexota bacterium]